MFSITWFSWNFCQHDLRLLPCGNRHKGTVQVSHLQFVFTLQSKHILCAVFCCNVWPSLLNLLLFRSPLWNQVNLFLFRMFVIGWDVSDGLDATDGLDVGLVVTGVHCSATSYKKSLKVDILFNFSFNLECVWNCYILTLNLSINKR